MWSGDNQEKKPENGQISEINQANAGGAHPAFSTQVPQKAGRRELEPLVNKARPSGIIFSLKGFFYRDLKLKFDPT